MKAKLTAFWNKYQILNKITYVFETFSLKTVAQKFNAEISHSHFFSLLLILAMIVNHRYTQTLKKHVNLPFQCKHYQRVIAENQLMFNFQPKIISYTKHVSLFLMPFQQLTS